MGTSSSLLLLLPLLLLYTGRDLLGGAFFFSGAGAFAGAGLGGALAGVLAAVLGLTGLSCGAALTGAFFSTFSFFLVAAFINLIFSDKVFKCLSISAILSSIVKIT